MKLRNCFLLVLGSLLSQQALAVCTVDPDPTFGGGSPSILNIPGYTIRIDAGEAMDPTGSIAGATSDSNTQGTLLSYKDCMVGDLYGKSAPGLVATGAPGLYKTNIEGLSVRPLWSNGSATGSFPSSRPMPADPGFPGPATRFNYPANSFFRLEFVKTAANLKLTDPNGDIVLNAAELAHNWITSDVPSNYAQRLQIGQIRIISTPNCTIDGERIVDFGIVTSATLPGGIEKPLNFGLRCLTDYGTYSATASLISTSANSDGTIMVTDQGGNTDRLKISMRDSNDGAMPADGSVKEPQINIASGVRADFNWKAVLQKGSSAQLPVEGRFNARAEVVLVVN